MVKEPGDARTEKKLDGFITPDGEYVRLDDLGAMEAALRRQYGGDEEEVLGADRLDHGLPSGMHGVILADSIERSSSRGRAVPRARRVH